MTTYKSLYQDLELLRKNAFKKGASIRIASKSIGAYPVPLRYYVTLPSDRYNEKFSPLQFSYNVSDFVKLSHFDSGSYYLRLFSIFADSAFFTPPGIESVPISDIERVNVSDFFEKLPHTYTSKCKICGRIVSNVKNHYLTHNPGNFVCPMCGCRRTRLDNLKVHIKQKHPDLVIEYKNAQYNMLLS